jgi:hypothetical protein
LDRFHDWWGSGVGQEDLEGIMRTIRKYAMTATEPLTVTGGSRLTVRYVSKDVAGGVSAPSVWIESDDDPNVPEEELTLTFIETDAPVPDGIHVGSCEGVGGVIWHVFTVERDAISPGSE